LKAPECLLPAARQEGGEMIGTEKKVTMDVVENLLVAFSQLHRRAG